MITTVSTNSLIDPFVTISYTLPVHCIKIESPNIGTTRLFQDYTSFVNNYGINFVISNIDCSDLYGKIDDDEIMMHLRNIVVKHFAAYNATKKF